MRIIFWCRRRRRRLRSSINQQKSNGERSITLIGNSIHTHAARRTNKTLTRDAAHNNRTRSRVQNIRVQQHPNKVNRQLLLLLFKSSSNVQHATTPAFKKKKKGFSRTSKRFSGNLAMNCQVSITVGGGNCELVTSGCVCLFVMTSNVSRWRRPHVKHATGGVRHRFLSSSSSHDDVHDAPPTCSRSSLSAPFTGPWLTCRRLADVVFFKIFLRCNY